MVAAHRSRLLPAASCLVGLAVAWKYQVALEGTEFSGGQTTGPLLAVHFAGGALFALALILTFFRPRTAAAGALLASLLCLPIYLYFATPGIFRRMFPGDYAHPLASEFVWEGWAATGILTVALTAYGMKTAMAGKTLA